MPLDIGFICDPGDYWDGRPPPGLVYHNILNGRGIDPLKRNLAPGGAPAAIVGAPVVHAGYVELSRSGGHLDLGLADSIDVTFFGVLKPPSGLTGMAFGCFDGAGTAFYYSGTAAPRGGGQTSGGLRTAGGGVQVGWAAVAMRIASAGGAVTITFDNLTTGERVVNPVAETRVLSPGSYLLGGHRAASGYAGVIGVHHATVCAAAMTDDDLRRQYQMARDIARSEAIYV